ncbi:hypothetical protein HYH02_000648 [Chlamydomonas schloesseri]|uniref:ubiquitinyl hydrolase 1 n=1 Tax=Chlamydomonas schloesseri TaxID=2026947 RepID=A0A835WYB7_9CHLO|nr:hypothetical protein HYH02_000648 [Chlamydomonas schloesseri]|eukprot:KAG2454816.1 hypothetical protein HYH02_000648 [Chlamydomonas schloesseri]
MDVIAPQYHERQSRQMCLKHTLNNLFQGPVTTSAGLDSLADLLSPAASFGFSAHRTAFLGNYDVNVLELALQSRNKNLQWVSPPHASAAAAGAPGSAVSPLWPEPALLNRPDLFALVLNVPSPAAAWGLASLARRLGLAGRHWLGFRRFGGQWYNLDSNLPAPQLVGDDDALRAVLWERYGCGGCGAGGPSSDGGRGRRVGSGGGSAERPQLLAVLDGAPPSEPGERPPWVG